MATYGTYNCYITNDSDEKIYVNSSITGSITAQIRPSTYGAKVDLPIYSYISNGYLYTQIKPNTYGAKTDKPIYSHISNADKIKIQNRYTKENFIIDLAVKLYVASPFTDINNPHKTPKEYAVEAIDRSVAFYEILRNRKVKIYNTNNNEYLIDNEFAERKNN